MVKVFPEPAIAPGFNIQFPTGKPPKTTLPVATSQVGCIIELMVGAEGIAGFTFITMLADGKDVHPDEFVTE